MTNVKTTFSNFCLGTVQFGMEYGLKNIKKIKIQKDEISKIFKFFYNNGGLFVDTAQNYGESEKNISEYLKKETKVITKIYFDKKNELNKSIEKSLNNLNITKLNTVLIHNPESLKYSSEPIDQLIKLKEKNYTDNIGISIYSYSDILDLPSQLSNQIFSEIDVLQVQSNAFDKHFHNTKELSKLNPNIRIDRRSIFLQGLLLQNIENASKLFPDFTNELKLWDEYCKNYSLSKIEAALFNIPNLYTKDSLVLFGCRNLNEIKEILTAAQNIKNIKCKKFNKIFPKKLIDPRQWK